MSSMAVCGACNEELVIHLEYSDDEEEDSSEAGPSGSSNETIPDDVELMCGCHFHWQCLLEATPESPTTQSFPCPKCGADISSFSATGMPQILCNLNNEGGLQRNLDILPLLTEEAYLRVHPEDKICRAFLEFCRDGDVAAIVDLLKICELPPEERDDGGFSSRSADEVLRFQDPIGEMQSGLHAAIAGSSREVVWLLLLLASNYPESKFPALVFQEAANLGVMRSDQTGKTDIRNLRDAQGKSAEQLAVEVGGVWYGWAGTGRLAI